MNSQKIGFKRNVRKCKTVHISPAQNTCPLTQFRIEGIPLPVLREFQPALYLGKTIRIPPGSTEAFSSSESLYSLFGSNLNLPDVLFSSNSDSSSDYGSQLNIAEFLRGWYNSVKLVPRQGLHAYRIIEGAAILVSKIAIECKNTLGYPQ